ncbi:sugar ABC transporter permease [Staphylococcus durrellii]|uniref:sugar ABC transporter permease n=1 Tax=Staphylococcus durrellii TaxID=2781773 RepID=UPI00189DD007|nr:sugar ABC transporter permease [Staphylococcus durrellii]MBF7016710.1 sugar ABC transporter permease [Staphylococcus durrellii]
MIDNLIYLFKNFPKLLQHSFAQLKLLWKWLVIPIITSLILLAIMILMFHLNKTPDLVQARWYYRLVSLITYGFLFTGVYVIYQRYGVSYYTGKMFNTPALIDTVCIALSYTASLFIILIIYIFSTPVNIESSIFAVLYYVIMLGILMVLIGKLLGLMTLLNWKIINVFIVLAIVMFLLLPIIYIPSSETSVFTNILMLNPVFYVVQGSSQSVVFGALSLNNIPYHLYFYCTLGIIGVIIFAFKRKIIYAKYNVTNQPDKNIDVTKKNEKEIIQK